MISDGIAWVNWRPVKGISTGGLLYIILFSGLAWLVIQVIDYVYRKVKSRKNR